MVGELSSGQFFEARINRQTIQVYGDLKLASLSRLSSAIHQVAVKSGYPDVIIDFESLSSITHSVIPPLAAYLRLLTRDKKIDFSYITPRKPNVAGDLVKFGLSHYIEHRRYPKPRLNSADPSLIQFMDQDEREWAVDKVLNSALRKTTLGRRQLAALEWAVNEITDNVLTHSGSKVGGFLICHKLANHNILEFTVADAGVGIARSLLVEDDQEALERAVQEGVTRNPSTNQGNGLYGSYQLALASAGLFVLRSGCGSLYVTKDGDTHIRREAVPYKGTYVVCQIDCDQPALVERALMIKGRLHEPSFNFVERKHEQDDGSLTISARDICPTFGSRQSGIEARRYINNLIREDNVKVSIDFSEVFVISSSFADEVFGKLFVELGPSKYMKRVSVVNVDEAIEGLIDRAITLRSKTGL